MNNIKNNNLDKVKKAQLYQQMYNNLYAKLEILLKKEIDKKYNE